MEKGGTDKNGDQVKKALRKSKLKAENKQRKE